MIGKLLDLMRVIVPIWPASIIPHARQSRAGLSVFKSHNALSFEAMPAICLLNCAMHKGIQTQVRFCPH